MLTIRQVLKNKVLLTWNDVVPTFQFKEKIKKFGLGNFKCFKKANFPKHFVSHLRQKKTKIKPNAPSSGKQSKTFKVQYDTESPLTSTGHLPEQNPEQRGIDVKVLTELFA